MAEEETFMLSSHSSPSERKREDDSYPNELLPLICCAILVLFIVMIILLIMLSNVYAGGEGQASETNSDRYTQVTVNGSGHGGNGGQATSTVTTDVESTASTTKSTTTTKTTSTALTTTTTTTTPFPGKPSRPGKPPRRYTLICAFEYVTKHRLPKAHQCTDYVYMRTFNYQRHKIEEVKILYFGRKRLKEEEDDIWNMYYDSNPEYWRDLRNGDGMYAYWKRNYPHADWYLGMWGQTYVRLLNSLWQAKVIMKGLHDYVRSNMSSYVLNGSDFEGFAILNTLIIDYRGVQQANHTVRYNIFRNNKTPILLPGWLFIHTAAIWPYGETGVYGIPNSFIQDVINSADIVGLSTHNSSEEPHVVYYGGDNNHALFASPPNPIRGATTRIRGMLDTLDTFPYWKKVLNRSKLCFSVTTAINYANASWILDFLIAPRETMRMTRRNFTGINPVTNMLEVQMRYMKYEWWERAATHAFVMRPNLPNQVGPLTAFFAYDDAATLAPKMKELLDAYPQDRCVVFDDLGDDSFPGHFFYNATTVHFERYDLLKVVSGAMINKYGGPAFPPEYY
ncbi:uncharacterized protein LOC144100309 isoform X2 [Amblyomma americanum]